MTTFTETWTGTNGSAWPSSWTTSIPAGAACDIQSNAGHQTTATTVGDGPSAYYNVNTSITDFDLYVTPTLLTSIDTYTIISFRADALVANKAVANNGYILTWNVDAGGSLQLWGMSSGSAIGLSPGVATNLGGQAGLKLRLLVVGSSLKAKGWKVADPEPGTWLIDITESTYTSGRISLGIQDTSAASSQLAWDDLTLNYPPLTAAGGPPYRRAGVPRALLGR